MMHFTARENLIIENLKRRIKNNIKTLETTEIDTVESHILAMLLRDFWVIEEKIDGITTPEDPQYINNVSHLEKDALYDLMHVLEDDCTEFLRPSHTLGLGESVLINEILYTHLGMLKLKRDKELEEISEEESKTE